MIYELENYLNVKEEVYLNSIHSEENIIESLEKSIESNNRMIETQNQEIDSLDFEIEKCKKELLNESLTISQQVIFFYYLFKELGVTFDNSDKSDWAKLISSVTGENEENIRKALDINFDDDATKKDMMLIAELVSDLLPDITQQILDDIG